MLTKTWIYKKKITKRKILLFNFRSTYFPKTYIFKKIKLLVSYYLKILKQNSKANIKRFEFSSYK